MPNPNTARCAVCLLLAFCALFLPMQASSADPARIEVPLNVGRVYLEGMLGDHLGVDGDGQARLEADACNRVEVHDLAVSPDDGLIRLDMAARAVTGGMVFGRCRGPAAWNGRVRIDLMPAVAAGGTAVEFRPAGFSVFRENGSSGLMEQAVSALVERLVMPRLGRARVDLAPSLESLETMLASWRTDTPLPGLPIRIAGTTAAGDGLEIRIAVMVLSRTGSERDSGPEDALAPEELAQWTRREDELDGFLTAVVVDLARKAESRDDRLELLAVLLDSRHRIAAALADPDAVAGADPVRTLFLDSWSALRPWMAEVADGLDESAGGQTLQLAAFLAAGDALRALDALGPGYGVEVSRDGLRRLARVLLGAAAPAEFTPLPLEPDPDLRALMGMKSPHPVPPGMVPPPEPLRWFQWLLSPAHAATASPADALHGMVPRLAILDDYLELVAALLETQTDRHLASSDRVPKRLRPHFDPLVRATAWKESCWRQYTGSPDAPRVLESAVGAVGMMQISARVWRGIYDLDRLSDDVGYNVAAGAEILEHYLVDYAIRRAEHQQPGGDDNLIRATYAAYNGGPSHLSRYRREDTPGRLRAIDNEFWRHYTTIKSEQWPDVSSCYAVGP